jgi:hypothetical protein
MSSIFEALTRAGAGHLTLGTVITADGGTRVVVRSDVPDTDPAECEVLQSSAALPLQLFEGDTVLFWTGAEPNGRGVVLGRVGASPHAAAVPDTLVLEAKEQLTLRVGDGSITLRADGKIQIKGKDLVSHAQRLNRIKGGAVSIN